MHWSGLRWPARKEPAYDVVTPTEHEALLAEIARRRRRYFWTIGPVLVLALFGFFVPAPTSVRVAALVVAAVLAPVAGIVGNARGRR
jgi:hypothetical protein